jgi:hypothetical protein
VFRLSFGPKSFVVVSDAEVAKHMLLTNASNYSKGLLSEILDFVMGQGASTRAIESFEWLSIREARHQHSCVPCWAKDGKPWDLGLLGAGIFRYYYCKVFLQGIVIRHHHHHHHPLTTTTTIIIILLLQFKDHVHSYIQRNVRYIRAHVALESS